METVPLGSDADRHEENQLLTLFDAPAYVRRARGVESAFEDLLASCRKQREEWLTMPRLRLGQLHALAGGWQALRPLLAGEEQQNVLEHLHETLAPSLRLPPAATTSMRTLRGALRELIGSLERFNARWGSYLDKVDLDRVNELRQGYNRYYVLEKACALRSDVLARFNFQPMPVLDRVELTTRLPFLPVPRLA